ncbi:MAG TPA: choice-of-anchor tandem repeat GloVer-containing protein [Terriglobia bacterium]|nr:choice-of-anchor tandem repeat GloVer-containing protein [Terriglobia bacterium]
MSRLGWLTKTCLAVGFCAVTAILSHGQTFATLVSFNGADGSGPFSSLVQGTDGNLYGTTNTGGRTACNSPYGCGTVFKVSPAGTLTMLYKFCALANCADGSFPYAGLVLGTDQNFYGTTSAGGTHSAGTIFKITARGALTTIYSFCAQANCSDGSSPAAAMVQATDGNFYGVTGDGGTSTSCTGGCGTVFKITATGKLTTLHSFDAADGYHPSSLVQGSDGDLYGTTYGTPYSSCQSTGCGTVFKMTSEGALTTLHTFNFVDGASPFGPLVESPEGSFSGTTYDGGIVFFEGCSEGCGTVFKITSAGCADHPA